MSIHGSSNRGSKTVMVVNCHTTGLNVEQKAEQYDKLMNLIRKKISHSDINEQIQLLTLAPQNCSREVLSEYFDVSEYLVRESREILNRAGILGKVEP